MNEKTAETLLRCYRQGKPNGPQVERAAQFAGSNQLLRSGLETQVKFDAQIAAAVRALPVPDDLAARLAARRTQPASAGKKKAARPQFTLPAILAVVLGGAILLGWLVILELEREKRFPGREAVEQMVRSTRSLSPFDLEPVAHPAGQLGDWFYMRGMEDFALPAELAALPASGSRVFYQDGKPVAQVAIERPKWFVSVFRASDFGVHAPADAKWHSFGFEGWSAALRSAGDQCVLVAAAGSDGELEKWVRARQ